MRADLTAGPHPPLQPVADTAPYDIVFLDRDGTLNERIEGGWVRTPEDLVMLEGAARAVATLNAAGVRVVLVTNQRGLATGAITPSAWTAISARLSTELAARHAHLDDVAVCPHLANSCSCRKPQPGLLLEVLEANPWAQPSRCVLIGDAASDLAAAQAAGIPSEQVEGACDLAAVVAHVLGGLHPRG